MISKALELLEPEEEEAEEGEDGTVVGKAKKKNKGEFKNIDDMSIEEYLEKMRKQGYNI